jgi:hypothetical protein
LIGLIWRQAWQQRFSPIEQRCHFVQALLDILRPDIGQQQIRILLHDFTGKRFDPVIQTLPLGLMDQFMAVLRDNLCGRRHVAGLQGVV